MNIVIFSVCVMVFSHLSASQKNFDPYKFNYCRMSCPEGKHSACECQRVKPRREQLHDIQNFRQTVIYAHNYWRDFVASGFASGEYNTNIPSAGNMMAINYDIELEYIARCYASSAYNGTGIGTEKCRNTHDKGLTGQNTAGVNKHNFTLKLVEDLIRMWFMEIKNVTFDDILSFPGFNNSKGTIGNFTQLVWWSTNRVGCARLWYSAPTPPLAQNSLICNYGNLAGEVSNEKGKPVYAAERPCGNCPEDFSCVSGTALCGEFLPIPDDPVEELPTSTASNQQWKKGILLISLLSVLASMR